MNFVVTISFEINQRIIYYHQIFNMSNSNNSTCRSKAVYLSEHLMLLLILVGNALFMHCSHELDER